MRRNSTSKPADPDIISGAEFAKRLGRSLRWVRMHRNELPGMVRTGSQKVILIHWPTFLAKTIKGYEPH